MLVFEPKVYLVGRTTMVAAGSGAYPDLSDYLEDHGRDYNILPASDAEELAVIAAKLCYDSLGKGRPDPKEFLEHILKSGHGSVLEHVSWNFIISGVSRTFSHEHVRHRVGCAISQRSQRYVDESDGRIVAQPLIEANPELKRVWEDSVRHSRTAYDAIVTKLMIDMESVIPDATLRRKTARSAARSVMPNATETILFWTANARALRHYIEMRATPEAELEIRRVAIQILKIMQAVAPHIFGDYTISGEGDNRVASTPYRKV